MSGRNRGGPPLPPKGSSHHSREPLPPIRDLPPTIRGLPPPIRGLRPPMREPRPPVREPPPPVREPHPPIHDLLPPVRELPFGRGLGPVPHPALLEEFRDSRAVVPGHLPPHPVVLEESLAAQHDEIHGLLVDNQGLAATHVALKQELEAAQYELQRMVKVSESLHAEKDQQMRELYDKSVRLEVDLREVEAMKAELARVNADIKELTAARQEFMGQVQAMSQDLTRMTADLRQVPAMRAEIENMKQEVQRARAAIEYEKKGSAENYEHGQVMEQNLVTMARELEKLRAEIANSEKRARTGGAVGHPGHNTGYENPEASYSANPYPPNYGLNPIPPGAEGYPQFGHGPTAWAAADTQQPHGHR